MLSAVASLSRCSFQSVVLPPVRQAFSTSRAPSSCAVFDFPRPLGHCLLHATIQACAYLQLQHSPLYSIYVYVLFSHNLYCKVLEDMLIYFYVHNNKIWHGMIVQ